MIKQFSDSKKMNLKKILFIFSIIITFLLLIANLNEPVLFPKNDLQINFAGAVECSENGGLIIDQQNTRLLFFNEKHEIVKVVKLGSLDAPCDEAFYAKIINDRIFIAGANVEKSGWYRTSEMIFEYDLNGNLIDKIYQYDFSKNEYITFPSVYKISQQKDGSLQVATLHGNRFLLIEIKDHNATLLKQIEASETLRRAFDFNDKGEFIINGLSGNWYLYSPEKNALGYIPESKAKKYCLDYCNLTEDQSTLLFGQGMFPANRMLSIFTDKSSRQKHIWHINLNSEIEDYAFNDNSNTKLLSFPISSALFCKTISFWVAALYALSLLLFIFYKQICRLKNKEITSSKYLKPVLFIILLSFTITGFYTKQTFNYIERDCRAIINEHLEQSYQILTIYYPDTLEFLKHANRNSFAENPKEHPVILKLQKHLQQFIHAGGKDVSFYIEVLFVDPETNTCYSLADSSGWNSSGTNVKDATDYIKEKKEDNIFFTTETQEGQYLQCYKYLRDENGKIYAIIDSGCMQTNLLARARTEAITNFFSLLAILIGLYLSWLCFVKFLARFANYKKMKTAGFSYAKSQLTGITYFLAGIAYTIDSVLAIFVIKEILQTEEISTLAFYTPLPSLCYSIGASAYVLLFAKMIMQKFSERFIGVIGAAGCVSAFFLMFISVQLHNIYIFLFAKILSGIFLTGCVYNIIELFPLSAEDNDMRFDALYEGQRFELVSTIAVMLGGVYFAEKFGYSWIYILPVISCFILTLILLYACGNKSVYQSTNEEQHSLTTKNGSFFLSTGGILFTISIMFPVTVALYYNQYIFPVICTAGTISPVMLTNLTVFAFVGNIVLTDIIKNYKKEYSLRTLNLINIFSLALLLICFAISKSIIWAVIVLFITVAFNPVADYLSYMFQQVNENGFSVNRTNIEYNISLNLLMVLRNTLFSSLAIFSIYSTSVIVGFICLILIIFYTWYSRSKKAC